MFYSSKMQTINRLIIEKEHYFMTNMNGIIISVLQCKALERFYVWLIKAKTKNPQLGLLYSAKHFAIHCGNAAMINTFSKNILK